MTKPTGHPMSRLALLLGLAMAGSAAQAADLASASATVSNWRYRLVDLDLTDGITPTLTINDKLEAGAATSIKITPDGLDSNGKPLPAITDLNPADLNRSLTGPVFDSTGTIELFSTLPGAKSSIGSTLSSSVNASPGSIADLALHSSGSEPFATIGIDESRGDGILRHVTGTSSFTEHSISFFNSALVSTQNMFNNVVLSANTLLVIEGTAAFTLHRDAALGGAINSAFSANDPSLDPNSSSFRDDSQAYVFIGLETWDILPLVSSTFEMGNTRSDNGSLDSATALDLHDEKNFSLDLSNNTNDAVNVNFNVGVGAYLSFKASNRTTNVTRVWGDPVDGPTLPDPGTTAPIPEPSTYALMGLGLVGLAAMKRRQQAQA